jgi:flagellar protein FlaG
VELPAPSVLEDRMTIMVESVDAVTSAPARTQEITAAKADSTVAVAAPSGNTSSPGGESLPPVPPPEPVIDVERAVARLNELMTSNRRTLHFSVDHASGRTVITVINAATNEIVRQIPPEELRDLARSLSTHGSVLDAFV